jgi:hypothetical protein
MPSKSRSKSTNKKSDIPKEPFPANTNGDITFRDIIRIADKANRRRHNRLEAELLEGRFPQKYKVRLGPLDVEYVEDMIEKAITAGCLLDDWRPVEARNAARNVLMFAFWDPFDDARGWHHLIAMELKHPSKTSPLRLVHSWDGVS